MNKKILILFIFTLFFSSILIAQNNTSDNDTIVKKYVVAIKQTPPFVIKTGKDFSGVSIELWSKIASELNIIYEYKEYTQAQFPQMLQDIEDGKVDICINPLTVTSERLKHFDFSLPFHTSNMVIIVPNKRETSILDFISNFFSQKFFKAILALVGILITMGFMIWIVENKGNLSFRKGIKGWGDGFWWAAVTMTTVGYGDKIPRTFFGRFLGLIWMFTSIILISSLTGSIAASLTVSEIKSQYNNLDDLRRLDKIGTMNATSSEDFLNFYNFNNIATNFETIQDGLQAVADGEIDAFIYDEAIVKFLINDMQLNNEIVVSPYKLSVIYYSFTVPKQNNEFLTELNPAIIEELESVNWIGVLNKYNLNE